MASVNPDDRTEQVRERESTGVQLRGGVSGSVDPQPSRVRSALSVPCTLESPLGSFSTKVESRTDCFRSPSTVFFRKSAAASRFGQTKELRKDKRCSCRLQLPRETGAFASAGGVGMHCGVSHSRCERSLDGNAKEFEIFRREGFKLHCKPNT